MCNAKKIVARRIAEPKIEKLSLSWNCQHCPAARRAFEIWLPPDLESRHASYTVDALRAANCRKSYLALISYLPFKHFRAIPQFFRFTFEIQRHLRKAPGLIGYALEARPFSKKSWMLSVWRD